MKILQLVTCGILILFSADAKDDAACRIEKTSNYTIIRKLKCESDCGTDGLKERQFIVCCKGYKKEKRKVHSRSGDIFKDECVPICEPACEKATCSAPNQCTCFSGHTMKKQTNSTHICEPHCSECQNGNCIAPEVCECFEGYGKRKVHSGSGDIFNNKCEPICEPACENATCSAPNQCTCFSGHTKKKQTNSTHICEPHCSECQNGNCIAPEVCECFEGYGKRKVHSGSGDIFNDKCEPICEPACENATCTAPNQCTCTPGHTMNEQTNSTHICVPHCTECQNGNCIAPEVCECLKGYGKGKVHSGSGDIFNDKCEPICEPACVNATCSAPNQCMCTPGHTMNEQTNSTHICVPHCSECQNGNCIAPEVCECLEGYGKRKVHSGSGDIFNDKCEPICEPACENATCSAPNQCMCTPGHTMNEQTNSTHICVPHCSECQNGNCIAPEVCECLEGYRKRKVHSGSGDIFNDKCEPICEPACVNATCSAPNQCTCFSGHTKEKQTNSTHICEPHCSECQNGNCIAPEVCECLEGYGKLKVHSGSGDISNDKCEPICEPACVNATCSAPNQCTCFSGHTLKKLTNSSHECTPFCKTDCIRGFCEAPNVCRCDKGTLKSGPFHCTPTCNEFLDDKECYFSSSLSISPLGYSMNEQNSSLVLSPNYSILHYLPCVDQYNTPLPAVVNYSCFTHPEAGVVSADIVCSIAKKTRQRNSIDEAERPAKLRSSEMRTLNLVLLHHNSSNLCTAHICSNSNREFRISSQSNLSMCIDGMIAEAHVMPISNIWLYIVIAIVVSSAAVVVVAKCVARNKFYNKSNPKRMSQGILVDEEPDGGELGPEAFEFTDISDRLEDLNSNGAPTYTHSNSSNWSRT